MRPTTLLDSPIQVSPRTWQTDSPVVRTGTAPSTAARSGAPSDGARSGTHRADGARSGTHRPDTARADTADFDRLVATMVPCRQHDPELWFAEQTADVERAKSLCRQCPLRQSCLEGALERREPWGVWGGEVFVGGVVVPRKRGRGRPRKDESPAA